MPSATSRGLRESPSLSAAPKPFSSLSTGLDQMSGFKAQSPPLSPHRQGTPKASVKNLFAGGVGGAAGGGGAGGGGSSATATEAGPKTPAKQKIVSRDDSTVSPQRLDTIPTISVGGMGPRTKGSGSGEQGHWSVSVAEARDDDQQSQQQQQQQQRQARTSKKTTRRRPVPASPQTYVLYVKTPTHNLTLQRTVDEIVELDQRLRQDPASAKAMPILPSLAPVQAQTGSRRILATISRTLSPNGSRSRTALSHLTGPLTQAGLVDNGTAKSTSAPSASATAASGKSSIASTHSIGTPGPSSSSSASGPPDVSISTDDSQEIDPVKKTISLLANYMTKIANSPAVRKQRTWQRFVRVRTDDLESVRVERRVHRVRSDLASHVKTPVAPTNVNVGSGPSHSDIGEDGGRTEDERDAASLSGRPGSRQSWKDASPHLRRPGSSRSNSDRAEGPIRSASSDNVAASSLDVGGQTSTTGKKSGPGFANIPEESDKERDAVTSAAIGADPATSEPLPPQVPAKAIDAERKERRRKRRTREPEKVTVDDFEMIRVLGKGCAGKVLLVRHRPTTGLFAMKSIHKRHVLAHQELQHTLTEQAVLKRMARDVQDPFVVKLWWSFHDKLNLYLVMDFRPGGDLATQLSRWGRLGRDRARFYAAEIVEGVEGLHKAGVIYRDLKPENVLIGTDGHIVLSDFGLSKEFPRRDVDDVGGRSTPPAHSTPAGGRGLKQSSSHWTSASEDAASVSTDDASLASPTRRHSTKWLADERDRTTTFCGTAEYLAPEVIQGLPYSYEVDWWSFGTMLFEMLTGVTPFWADSHADMYVRVLHDELVFPDDRVLDQDTKSILRGLLQRNPTLRMKEPRIKRHPYFSMIEWDHVFHKRYIPPYIPPIDPSNAADTQNFDEAFLDMQPVVNGEDDEPDGGGDTNGNRTNGAQDSKQAAARGAAAVVDEILPAGNDADATSASKSTAADSKSLFDGYSFRNRKDSGSIRSTAYSDSIDLGAAASQDGLSTTAAETTTPLASVDHTVLSKVSDTGKDAGDVSAWSASPELPLSGLPSVPTSAATPTQSPASVSLGSTSTPVIAPIATRAPAPPPELEPEPISEDDETAALDALMALDALERQASAESSMISQSQASASTKQTSVLSKGTDAGDIDIDEKSNESAEPGASDAARPKGPARPATAAVPVHDSIAEDDDEEVDGTGYETVEEDWDVVDTANNVESEFNGGRGQNLFSRGVVDTYRLLRRQDSTRLAPPQTGSGGSSRPFSRLGAGRQRKTAGVAGNTVSGLPKRSTEVGLTSGSVASLESSNLARAGSKSPRSRDANGSGIDQETTADTDGQGPLFGMSKLASSLDRALGGSTPEPHNNAAADGSSDKKGSLDPSASSNYNNNSGGSNGNGNGNGNGKVTPSSSSRIKRRFTTFFEQTGR
ncbi:unnamed protein product [Jaminaea pallidilutea]